MQTFLPFPDFEDSAWALAPSHLGNQRNESLIIARSLVSGRGWPHHAVTRQWSRNLGALLLYGKTICRVWQQRNPDTPDTVAAQLTHIANYFDLTSGMRVELPDWFGVEELHRSHRSNLLRKDHEGTVNPPGWYREQGWHEPRDLPYWYPSHNGYEWDRPPVDMPEALGLA